jgi:hypothetical protein
MARSLNGASDWLARSLDTLYKVSNLSISLWFYPTAANTSGLIAMEPVGSFSQGTGVYAQMTSGKALQLTLGVGGSFNVATSSGTVSLNTWNHYGASFDGTTGRVYVNGSADGTVSSAAISWGDAGAGSHYPTPAELYVGASRSDSSSPDNTSANQRFLTGSIAEVTLWSAALAASQFAALAQGINPRKIRGNPLGYWPLWGLQNPEPDVSGNAGNLTLLGSPAQANHAPVETFTRQQVVGGQLASADRAGRLPRYVVSKREREEAWYE